ncbi:O-antigen ligase family protein [Candidatus Microgenomates bacterium]|nr:O-antigen ligase family protein [Candidatus Microgenomates bacterium]
MVSLLKISLLLTVFALPLISPFNAFGYEKAKVIVFLFLNSFNLLLWVLALWKYPKKIKIKWNNLKLAGLVFIIILFIASLSGVDLLTSLVGREPYFQGWVVYSYLFTFYLMVSSIKIPLKNWATVLITSATIVSLIAIKDWLLVFLLNINLATYAGRVGSTFGQPNFYAGFLLLALPFLTFLKINKLAKILAALILGTGIILSGSRIAILFLPFLLYFWLVISLKINFKKAIKVLGIVITLLIIATGIYLLPRYLEDSFGKTKNWYDSYSPERREYIWLESINLIKEKFVLGYGLENLATVFGKNLKPEIPNGFPTHILNDIKNLTVNRTHNYLLDLAIFSGIGGVISYLVILWLIFKRASQKLLLIPLIIYLIWVQFQNQSIVHLLYFWLLVGLIDSD